MTHFDCTKKVLKWYAYGNEVKKNFVVIIGVISVCYDVFVPIHKEVTVMAKRKKFFSYKIRSWYIHESTWNIYVLLTRRKENENVMLVPLFFFCRFGS
jgi:hypothetical protein